MRRIWVVEARYRVKDGTGWHDWVPMGDAYWVRSQARDRRDDLDDDAVWTECRVRPKYRVRPYAAVIGAKG